MAFEGEQRFARFDVLFLDDLLAFALDLVGLHALLGGQVDDLLPAFGIEDVVRIKQFERGLLQVVDRRVFQAVAVQIAADDLHDLIFELIALVIEVDEVHLLADGFQRFGKLGLEQFFERAGIAGALDADCTGDLEHVLGGFVHPHEEGDLDVGADIVRADQAVGALTIDLDGLERDVHDLDPVEQRDDDRVGKPHRGLGAEFIDDHGKTLIDLAQERAQEEAHAEEEDRESAHHHDADDQRRIRLQESRNFSHDALLKNHGCW